MDTETLDKLYLEWSQFTKAKTKHEIYLESTLNNALHMCETRTLGDVMSFLRAVCKDLKQDN